jgi:hypothetical protein
MRKFIYGFAEKMGKKSLGGKFMDFLFVCVCTLSRFMGDKSWEKKLLAWHTEKAPILRPRPPTLPLGIHHIPATTAIEITLNST